MAGTKEYIAEFGSKSFEELPFSDSDALTLCEMFYMPLEQTVSSSFDDEPVEFSKAANELYALRNYKHKKLGLMITKNASVNMVAMAATQRYCDMKIYAVNEVYSFQPAIQYCAGTFILPDGTLVVIFRGTDDTIAGWKEDLDLFVKKNPPAYELALNYIEKLASHKDGNFIICGHSKGGNIALHTALKCSDEVRHRIKGIYNCDGPGYHDFGIFHLGTYDEILPVYKHYVPSSSMIGMLLAHDYDYKAVKSSRLTGAFQHDIGTWQIDDGEIVTLPDVNKMAKLTDAAISRVCSFATDEVTTAIDNITTLVIGGIGQETLTETAKHIASSIKGISEAIKEISPVDKDIIKEAFKGSGKFLVETVKDIKNSNVAEMTRLAYSHITR